MSIGVEGADAEIALLAEETDRGIRPVNALDQRSNRRGDENGRPGLPAVVVCRHAGVLFRSQRTRN